MLTGSIGKVLFAVACGLGWAGSNHTINDVIRLKNDLLQNGYDVTTRPVIDQSLVINISATYYLFAISHVDDVRESLTTTGYLFLTWTDENLIWNPSRYNGVEYILLHQNQIWKPDVVLKNSVKGYSPLGDESLNIRISYDGVVSWYPMEVFVSSCKLDITYFPFDKQTCYLKFVAWSYTKYEVLVKGQFEGITFFPHDYEPNSEWDVLDKNFYIQPESFVSEIIFRLDLQRKPTYSLLTLVFPVILLSFLNLFVFVLPTDSGEKASCAVTLFLAFTVFLTIMAASFPPNSETVSYFAVFVIWGTVQSATITIISVVMTRFAASREGKDVPGWLLAIVRCTTCKTLFANIRRNKVEVAAKEPQQLEPENATTSSGKPNGTVYVVDDIENNQRYTWKYCIDSLDSVLFILLAFSFFISVIWFFLTVKTFQ